MNRSVMKALVLFSSLALLSTAFIACGAPSEECKKNSDCSKKGKDYVCSAGKDGKKSCKKNTASKCTADADCKDAAKPVCNTSTGACEAKKDEKCTADADCKDAAKPVCNTTTGACEAKDDTKCKADSDCTDPTKPVCNTSTGACEAKKDEKCTADADCKDAAKPVCNTTTGACEAKSNECKPACGTNEECKEGKCVPKTNPKCTADADCTDAAKPVCNTTTGVCEAPPEGTKEAGEVCTPKDNCKKGLSCIPTSQTERLCFQECTADADCASNAYRKTCVTLAATKQDGSNFRMCLNLSKKDEFCGFKSTDKKQALCSAGLYCSQKVSPNKCLEPVVQKNEGDACNKRNDTAEPRKVCDTAASLICDEASGTCKKAKVAKEGEDCDPTGADGEKILCEKDYFCLDFSRLVRGSQGRRCHKICDPKKQDSCNQTTGLSCRQVFQNGNGLCMDQACTKDDECALSHYQCAQLQGGTQLCLPKPAPGPVKFGGVCKEPNKKFGCDTTQDPNLLCLRRNPQAKEGFCSRNCTQDNKCDLPYKTSKGTALTAQCIEINPQTQVKACLFVCTQPGTECPDGTQCTDLGASKYCFPAN